MACETGWRAHLPPDLSPRTVCPLALAHELRRTREQAVRHISATLETMRPSEALNLYRSRIREIALSHRVSNVRVFGSVLRGEDDANSDLDLLVEPTAQTTLMDIGAIRFELKKLLGFEVDVLTPNGLPLSFRAQVLREAMPV